MQRVFGQINGNQALLKEEDLYHLLNVVRLEVGEEIELVAESKLYSVILAKKNPPVFEVVKEISKKAEPDNSLLLAFGLLKGDHNELIVEKGTEFGACTFLPFISSRVIVRTELGKEDNRLRRLRLIAESSAKQCRRTMIPEVKNYQNYETILDTPADIKLFAYEKEFGSSNTLLEMFPKLEKGKSVLLLIGPEGGFSEKEAELALSKGFKPISLGRRILRAESAAFYGLALLSALSEEE